MDMLAGDSRLKRIGGKIMPRLATKQINFRVSDDELLILEEYAGRAGLKLPAYCKAAALKVKVRPQVIDKETGKAILPQLSHIGNNINQLAKRANEGGTVAAAELREVKEELEKIWDYLLTGKKPEKQEEAKPEAEEHGSEKEIKKEQKPEISSSSPSSAEVEPPKCELCGAVMKPSHRKSDNSPIWFCPNWKDKEKGEHSFLERVE